MSDAADGGTTKFAPGESIVKKFDHWRVVVKGRQETLGDVTFVLTRTVESLGDVTSEEMGELPEAVRWFENAAKTLFAPDRIDYSVMLTRDPNVHLDAYPRYDREIERYGTTWRDTAWPDSVSGHGAATLTRDQQHQICADYATQA